MYDKLFFGSPGSSYEYARLLRLEMTKAEKILWRNLRNRQLSGYKFRRQQPVENYIADFYCLEKSLVVEVDGEIHMNNEQKKYDEDRTRRLNELGVKVIRFKNEEIFNDIDKVLRQIVEELDKE